MADRVPYHEVQIADPNGVPKIMTVPVVQELAIQGAADLPEQFIRKSQDELESVTPTVAPIPVIDMAKIQSELEPEVREEEIRKLRRAAKEWGLFLVKNPGIMPEVLNDFKTAVKEFFDLSYEEKKASVGSNSSFENTGYGRNYIRSENQSLDWHDRLSMKPFPADETKGIIVWPQNPANFRLAGEKYLKDAMKLCDDILQALAESLSAEKEAFLKYFNHKEKNEVAVLVNFYPPCPRTDLALGLVPHSDAGALTILMEFGNSGGLQVYKDRKWVSPQWPIGELLVVVGDLMQIMSNGEFESAWHRVATQNLERYSVAAFYTPPSDTEIGPLNVGNGGYKKVAVGEYIRNYYKIFPAPTKEAIKYAQM